MLGKLCAGVSLHTCSNTVGFFLLCAQGTTVIGACAVSLAMALRSLRRLEVAEMWFQGRSTSHR
jgi:hypothetical protein